MSRWLMATVTVLVLSVIVPLYVTLWLVLGAVQDIEQRREAEETARAEQIEAIRGQGECVLRMLLVEPDQREGFTVDRILDSCPDALPEREDGGGENDDEFDTGEYPESRQPWEVTP